MTYAAFIKEDPKHQEAAIAAWKRSGATRTYIGEWHSHPIGRAEPSNIDKNTWREIATRLQTQCVFVLVVPGQWTVFLQTIGIVSRSFNRLKLLELGESGLVFG
jgi:integrative and conjugative element protein (TIGR02256 family)